MRQFKCPTLCLIFLSCFSILNAQQILLQEEISLKFQHSINAFYGSYSFDEHNLLLADTRNKGDLNTLIIAFDQRGEILQEIEIGHPSFYERPVGIVKVQSEYLLLLNKIRAGKRQLEIVKLSKSLRVIETIGLSIYNLDEATAISYNQADNKLNIAGSKCDNLGNCYPVLYKINTNTFAKESALPLNKINDPKWNKGMQVVSIMSTDEFGKPVFKGKQKVAQNNTFLKSCNRIICANENCDELILIGLESTTSITDFWAAKIANDQIEWEYIYQTKIGGDEAFDVFINDDESILVTGLDYTKSLKENYQLKSMLLNSSGEVLNSNLHRKNMRSMYRVSKQIGEQYLMIGHAQNIKYPSTPLGMEYTENSDIHLVLIDIKGNLITEYLHETEEIDIVHSLFKLNDDMIMVIFERDTELMSATFLIH